MKCINFMKVFTDSECLSAKNVVVVGSMRVNTSSPSPLPLTKSESTHITLERDELAKQDLG